MISCLCRPCDRMVLPDGKIALGRLNHLKRIKQGLVPYKQMRTWPADRRQFPVDWRVPPGVQEYDTAMALLIKHRTRGILPSGASWRKAFRERIAAANDLGSTPELLPRAADDCVPGPVADPPVRALGIPSASGLGKRANCRGTDVGSPSPKRHRANRGREKQNVLAHPRRGP